MVGWKLLNGGMGTTGWWDGKGFVRSLFWIYSFPILFMENLKFKENKSRKLYRAIYFKTSSLLISCDNYVSIVFGLYIIALQYVYQFKQRSHIEWVCCYKTYIWFAHFSCQRCWIKCTLTLRRQFPDYKERSEKRKERRYIQPSTNRFHSNPHSKPSCAHSNNDGISISLKWRLQLFLS